MKRLLFSLSILVLAFVINAFTQEKDFPVLKGPYLGQTPPGMKVELFADGIIPTDGINHCVPTFSPDGLEVYWIEFNMETRKATISFMHQREAKWTQPQIAPFSGEHNDQCPIFSKDGKRLNFTSSRPDGLGKGDTWYVEKHADKWSEPVNLGAPVNTELSESQPSFTNDNTMYFLRHTEANVYKRELFRSEFRNGKYSEAISLGKNINTASLDYMMFVSPDESYLLFVSNRPKLEGYFTEMYVSFREKDNTWGKPVKFGEDVNNGQSVSCPYVTLDGKYLFFNRFNDKDTDVFYWVDARIIEQYR